MEIRELPAAARATFRGDVLFAASTGILYGMLYSADGFDKTLLHASDREIFLISMSQSVGLLLSLFVGAWVEGRRKVPFVVAPEAVARGSLLAIAFATTSPTFTALVCLAFALDGVTEPAKIALYRRNYPDSARGAIVGRVRAVRGLAWLATAGIAALVVRARPEAYRWLYPAAGLLGMLGCLAFSRIPESHLSLEKPPLLRATLRKAVGLLAHDRGFAGFMALWFVFGFSQLMTRPLIVILLASVVEPLGKGPAAFHAAVLLSVVPQVIWIATSTLWGGVLDRHGPVRMRGSLNIVWAVSPFLWAFAPVLPVFYVAQCFQGIAQGGTQLVWALGVLPYAKKPEDAPLYMGVHATLTGIRGILAPLAAAGLAYAIGTPGTLAIAGSLMALSGVATLLFVDPREGAPRAAEAEPARTAA